MQASGTVNKSEQIRIVDHLALERPIRVLHLIEALGAGGAERLLYTNLKYLGRDHFQSEVITVFSHPDHWKTPIQALGVEVNSLNCNSLRDLLNGVWRLRRHLRSNPPDIIHTHLWAANIIGRLAGRLSRIPVISSIHNPDHESDVWNDGAKVNRLKRVLVKQMDRWTAYFGCNRMVAVSEYVRRSAEIHLRFPLESIDLLYNPIDINHFQPSSTRSRIELLSELDLPIDSILLLNVARVAPQKGMLHAIRALPSVIENHPSARLISVGSTADRYWLSKLRSEAATLGVAENIRFLGTRSDIRDFLGNCDLFIFPSLYEGLGISLIEAMAMGCACVATETGPIPEIIKHGIDGVLVPPADAEALSNAICLLLADNEKRQDIGSAAIGSVIERFHPEISIQRLQNIYNMVTKQKRSDLHYKVVA